MFKRIPWLVIALVLPFLMQGLGGQAIAQDGLDVSGSEWNAFPDKDAVSGRFLAVSGLENAGLPKDDVLNGIGPDPRQVAAAIVFPVTAGPDIRLATFDGDTKGLWDQRDNQPPVISAGETSRPYETRYRIYPDPTGGVARAISRSTVALADPIQPVDDDGNPEPTAPVNPVRNVSSADPLFTGKLTEWVEIASFEGDASTLVDLPLGWPESLFPGKEGYVYTFRANLEPGSPQTPLSEFELNGFKLAFTGVGRLPEGSILGFIGGAVDSRTVAFVSSTLDPLPGQVIPGDAEERTNGFKGIFDIGFLNTLACEDLLFAEADADWVLTIPTASEPDGIPPDDGGEYFYDVPPFGLVKTDNTLFRITLAESIASLPPSERPTTSYAGGLAWEVLDPNGVMRLNSNLAPSGHPSITASKQDTVPSTALTAPFQVTTLDKAIANQYVGERWNWRWYGVDSRNLIWVRREGGTGPDVKGPPSTGTLWCDLNENGVIDVGEPPVANADVRLEFVAPPIAPIQLLVSTDPQTVTTDANGVWQTNSLAGGTWQIVSITQAPGSPFVFTANALPQQFVVDSCDGATVLTPGKCTTAGISGRVYCDVDQNLRYNNPPDTPLAGVSVTLTKQGDANTTATTTTLADGTYGFADVPAGTWVVAVDTTQTALLGKTAYPPTSLTITLLEGEQSTGNDFRFCCEGGEIAGRVYCDNDKNAQYASPPDKPLAGVTVQLLDAQDVLITTTLTDVVGQYTFGTRTQGSYQVAVDPAQPVLKDTTLLSTTPVPVTIECGADVKVDFRFLCPGYISGYVIRESVDCDGVRGPGEPGIPGVEVMLVRTDIPPTAPQFTTTDANGFYEFRPLDPGTYQVSVDLLQANVVLLKASVPASGIIAPVVVEPLGGSDENNFHFCPGEIIVRVFQKQRGKDCINVWETGDTPIANVFVTMTGPLPSTTLRSGFTDALGVVSWDNLDAGQYTVNVDGTQTQLVTLVPAAGATSQNVTLPPGEQKIVDSLWCEQDCSIKGSVIRRGALCVTWWPGGGIPGVRVDLIKASDNSLVKFTTTDANGDFLFDEIFEDVYLVRIPDGQTMLADMTALTPTSREAECGSTILFEYGTAGIWVKVLVDVDCGGTPDGGLVTTVTLTKKDAPGIGRVFTGQTDASGNVQFPTSTMNALPTGMYDVTIPPQGRLIPKGPLTQTVSVVVCQPITVTFEFCDVGSLVGYVIKEIVDCDGVRQPGEPGIPGVTVRLVSVPGGTVDATDITDINGFYSFTNLQRGTYAVSVDGGQPLLVNYTPTSPLNVGVTIIPPAEERVDFYFCPPSRIYGKVFKNRLRDDCDKEYQTGDIPIPLVEVELWQGGVVQQVALTDGNGDYEFNPLSPGVYTVIVEGQQPLLINLSPADALVVGPFTLKPEDERQIDFPFCQQAIYGTVFREPAGDCDGIFNTGDVGIALVTVTLIKTDAPQLGLTRSTLTDGDGDYGFEDLPTGIYEIFVPGGQAQLVDLSQSSPQPLTPTLLAGEIVEDQDFGYCPLLGSICGKVFLNDKESDCNQIFETGDIPLAGVRVVLRYDSGPLAGTEDFTVTDSSGDFCFYELEAGVYTVFVAENDPIVVGLDPQQPTRLMPINLAAGAHETVDFPYCKEDCPEDCCEGDLHEIVIETKFWLDTWGDDWKEDWYDIYAYFWDGCKKGAREIDYAGVYYKGEFPGAETGYNDVLTLESARVENGYLIVRLRLTAQGCAFPRGFFGKKCRTVGVWFNGCWNRGKASFRCECVRPGSWFTWEECCEFPECEEKFADAQLNKMILAGPPSCCNAEFLTRETLSWENWIKCEWTPPECKEQSRTCKCGYNLVEFELDYWVEKKRRETNVFDLDLKKNGKGLIDELTLRFQGYEWYGKKKSENGLVFLRSVKRVSYEEAVKLYGKDATRYFELWRARILVRACDRIDGNPAALPEQLEFCTTLNSHERNYWLDLNNTYWWEHCLELGQRYWDGDLIGVNILRWLSVEDAAWCRPYICEGTCRGCGGYCVYCPEPTACDCEKDCDDCSKKHDDVACGCGK